MVFLRQILSYILLSSPDGIIEVYEGANLELNDLLEEV